MARSLTASRVRLQGRSGGVGQGSAAAPAWTPASLTSLRGWYRADLGITLAGDPAVDVDAWADQSGVGNHLTAAAAGNRPLYVASSAIFGDQACVEFDGVGEWLRDAAFSWGGSVGPASVIFVGESVSVTGGEYIWNYNGTGGRPFCRQAATNRCDISALGATVTSATNGDLTPGTAKLITFSWDLSNQNLYVGTTNRGPTANSGSAHSDGAMLSLGATTSGTVPTNIRVAEFIVMRAAITAGELTSLYSYAQTRYGIS